MIAVFTVRISTSIISKLIGEVYSSFKTSQDNIDTSMRDTFLLTKDEPPETSE